MSAPLAAAKSEVASETRFKRLSVALVLAYLTLALAHGGEFWPFSRFPMFSNAKKTWLRATLRELDASEPLSDLHEVGEKEVLGRPFPLGALAIDQNDLSEQLKSMGDSLEPAELAVLQRYFANVGEHRLLLYTVRGRLRSDRSVRVRYRPLALVTKTGVAPLPLADVEPSTP